MLMMVNMMQCIDAATMGTALTSRMMGDVNMEEHLLCTPFKKAISSLPRAIY